MVEFQIRTQDSLLVRGFYAETAERLKNPGVKQNPYNSHLLVVCEPEGDLVAKFKLESIYPNIEYFVIFPFVLMLGVFLFGWAKWLLIPFGCLTVVFIIIWASKTAIFHYWVLSKAMAKYGYKGPVKLERIGLEGFSDGPDGNTRILEKTEIDG